MRRTELQNTFKRVQLKLDREYRQIKFLKECKKLRIIPRFLSLKNKILRHHFEKELIKVEMRLLKKVIREKYGKLNRLKNNLKNIQVIVERTYTPDEMKIEYIKIEKIRNFEKWKHNNILDKKLDFWCKKYGRNRTNFTRVKQHTENTPFINKSKYNFTKEEEKILNKGPKFILNQKVNIKDFIPKFERTLKYAPESERSRIRNLVQTEIEKQKRKENREIFEDLRTIQNLKKTKDVTFLLTDKTGKLAVLDTEDYNELMEKAITKIGVKKINRDPNCKLTKKSDELIKNGRWPKQNPKKLNYTPNTPFIFGRLKDHKTPQSLRPIVNKTSSPLYDLEKFMKSIYQELMPTSNVSINSTNMFLQKIKEFDIKNGNIMLSLDIENMYPSIDVNEMNQIINKKIEETYEDTDIITTLKSTTNLLLGENYFRYKENIFKQITGVPMGSPISGIIAEWKIRLLEEDILKDLGLNCKIWIRYVDDIFLILNNEAFLPGLIEKVNSYDKNIQFTQEIEKGNCISFLDVLLKKENNELITTVYRKHTDTNRLMDKSSKTLYMYKTSGLKSNINRAIKICSNQETYDQEIKEIKYRAYNKGYSKREVNKIIKAQELKYENIQPQQKQKKIYTTPIPFIPAISLRIKKEFHKLNLEVPISPNKSIYSILRNEIESFDPLETAGIYQIFFEDHRGTQNTYIGLTKRKIKERYKEHNRDLQHNQGFTAIALYNKETKINPHTLNVKKISNYNNMDYAAIRETLEIQTSKFKVCNLNVSVKLDNRWSHIAH